MWTTKIKQISFLLVLTFVACEPASNSMFKGEASLVALEEAYKAEPTAITGSALIKGISEALNDKGLDGATETSYMEYGLEVARTQKIPTKVAGFLFPLIRKSSNSAETPERMLELASVMKRLRKESASNTICKGLLDNYPDFSKKEEAKQMLTESIDTIGSYLSNLGAQLFIDADETGINRKAAMSYVDACEAYALSYSTAPDAADNLFKAAEVAKSIRTFPKSLTLYDWILEKYPNYEKAPTSLFLKGFIIENNLKDDVKAREIYDSFLAKYPSHDLADDVEFLIENLGKTDEQILEMIEQKRKEREASDRSS